MGKGKRLLVITGVPGTGKTTFSDRIKRSFPDVEVIHVTRVVNKKKLFSSISKEGEKIVNMRKLLNELKKMISRSDKKNVVLESHLLCDMKIAGASAIVLREHLRILEKRMTARGYRSEKIKANLVSEATDYCGLHAKNNYGHVIEAFTGDKRLMKFAREMLDGKKPVGDDIDLLPEFDIMLKHNMRLLG